MLTTIANLLLFIVLAVGVWTIVCMVAKMPWVYDLFAKTPYKQVKLEVWVATDEDGFIGVYSRKPIRFDDGGGKWGYGGFVMCANDRLKPFSDTIELTWKDEPLKATITIDVTAKDYAKAKIPEPIE